MFSNKSNIIKIAGVYTGLILGAGFASGQELLQFFAIYGRNGIYGLILSGVVFALCGWAVLDICFADGIDSYGAFITKITGPTVGTALECIVAVFLMVLFATMLAAGGATVREAFGISDFAGVVAIGLVCFVIFLFDLDGMVEVNVILAPIMVIGGIFIGLYTFFFEASPVFAQDGTQTQSWFRAAVVYSSYNLVTAITVLSAMGRLNDSRKTAAWGGIVGGACMGVLGICLSLPLFLHIGIAADKEIPILAIVSRYGSAMKWIYLFILLSAVITTAVGNGFAFIEWLRMRVGIPRVIVNAAVVLLAVSLANVGFSTFVVKVYPLFGIIGFFEVVMIFIYILRRRLALRRK